MHIATSAIWKIWHGRVGLCSIAKNDISVYLYNQSLSITKY